jgi:heat shock protein HtpX
MKTFVLLAGLSGLLLLAGAAVRRGRTVIALGIALVMNVGTYWFSDKLAIKMARRPTRRRPSSTPGTTRWSTSPSRPGSRKPRLYVSPSPQPNAFATGRNPRNAAVCVNQGLIDLLDRDEMEGVLAHELMHVYNRDILIGTIAATIATAVMFLSRFALFFGGRDRNANPAAQLAAGLPGADRGDAHPVRGDPQPGDSGRHDRRPAVRQADGARQRAAEARVRRQGAGPARHRGHPGGAVLGAFSSLYISAPFGGLGQMGKLFRTHPTTETRVRNLQQIARGMGHIA